MNPGRTDTKSRGRRGWTTQISSPLSGPQGAQLSSFTPQSGLNDNDREPLRSSVLMNRLPERFDLRDREIHVWYAYLTGPEELEPALLQTLSIEETLRRDRFRLSHLRRSFTLSHGILRQLLSRYIGVPAAQIVFGYGPAEKPFINIPNTSLQFNMSHSGELAVYAFGRGCRIGVDIEHMRLVPDLESIASRFFSRQEHQNLINLTSAHRPEAFLTCWTRKEAYIKAVGNGFSASLDSFQVTLAPNEEPALIKSSPNDDSIWNVRHLRPNSRYVGAVVFDGNERTVIEHAWTVHRL